MNRAGFAMLRRMPTPQQSNAIHDHLSAALLALAEAVTADHRQDEPELVEIARLLTAAQQKLHGISRAIRSERDLRPRD